MKRWVFCIAFLALPLCAFVEAPKPVTAQVDDDVVVIGSAETKLRIQIDWRSDELVVKPIQSVAGTAQDDLLRWYSRDYFAGLGQDSPGYLIYTRDIALSQIFSDPKNDYAEHYQKTSYQNPSDDAFAALRWDIIAANDSSSGLLCSDNDGATLMEKMRSRKCFTACSGHSIIAADLLEQETRIILLHADAEDIGENIKFLRSEWHTSLERRGADGSWYLADPTFGFAYVEAAGRRLSAQEFIDALEFGNADKLTFGVTRQGALYSLSGETMLREEPTLASLYYTPDKRLEYQIR